PLVERFRLGPGRGVLEVASNDGYLLQFFQARGVPVLGVEPARNVAAVARARGIPTLARFFGPDVVEQVLGELGRAEVVVGNNVLAHVPAVNAFLTAVRDCLAPAAAGLTGAARFTGFAGAVDRLRGDLVSRLRRLRADGRRLAAYGAPAKGTVLLNACGLGTDVLEFTVDRSPHKQGRLVPGVRLPIRPPEDLVKEMPDVTLLLPWNLADEIVAQQVEYLRRGGAFLVPVPAPRLVRGG